MTTLTLGLGYLCLLLGLDLVATVIGSRNPETLRAFQIEKGMLIGSLMFVALGAFARCLLSVPQGWTSTKFASVVGCSIAIPLLVLAAWQIASAAV